MRSRADACVPEQPHEFPSQHTPSVAHPQRSTPPAQPTSRMSPPRMSSPRRAPALVPTRTAVGAARPRAQGQAMTSTLQAICGWEVEEGLGLGRERTGGQAHRRLHSNQTADRVCLHWQRVWHPNADQPTAYLQRQQGGGCGLGGRSGGIGSQDLRRWGGMG